MHTLARKSRVLEKAQQVREPSRIATAAPHSQPIPYVLVARTQYMVTTR